MGVKFWLCKDCSANKDGRTGSKQYNEKSLIEHLKLCSQDFSNALEEKLLIHQKLQKDFYDVTLACEDKQIKTQKLVTPDQIYSNIYEGLLKEMSEEVAAEVEKFEKNCNRICEELCFEVSSDQCNEVVEEIVGRDC